jgi:hypothetical protein
MAYSCQLFYLSSMEAYTITIGPPYNIIVLIQRLLFQYNDTGEIVVDILSLSAIALSLSLW